MNKMIRSCWTVAVSLVLLSGYALGAELAPAGVEKALAKHRVALRQCYERQVRVENTRIAGTVTVQITVNPDGKVSDASIKKTTLKNHWIEYCLLEVIQGVDFPRPVGEGDAVVSYPFKFSRKN
ncbi:MAG: TonB family protein [Oligoflexia bacterium]|nr:TonB family protein [Oligoflexia bacterium]